MHSVFKHKDTSHTVKSKRFPQNSLITIGSIVKAVLLIFYAILSPAQYVQKGRNQKIFLMLYQVRHKSFAEKQHPDPDFFHS